MYKQKLTLGVAPVKRSFLSMEEAKRQKDKFMAVIRNIKPDAVEIVDVDDQCENGIMWDTAKVPGVVEKFRRAGVDALFIPFCDFGEEQVAAQIAAAFKLPTLVWGARDERPNSDEARGRDTQCGMFAATKVLRRHGVKYSYIYNCETESDDFKNGYENFLRVATVLKALKDLRVAKIGERPVPFMSVMTNEANLINRFGVTTIPVSPYAVAERAKKLIADNDPVFKTYYEDLTSRMDSSAMTEENVKKAAATKIAIQGIMEENNCSVGAFECWSAFPAVLGVCPCVVLGEMADAGYPLACETDVNGAITLGTLDGANVEIADAAGKENELIFGMLTPEVNNLKQVGYHPNAFITGDDVANYTLNFLERGWNGENFHEVTENLRTSDPYMVMADFKDYRRAQADLQKLYGDREKWAQMSLKNTANSGIFSADRAVLDYARDIWYASPVPMGK